MSETDPTPPASSEPAPPVSADPAPPASADPAPPTGSDPTPPAAPNPDSWQAKFLSPELASKPEFARMKDMNTLAQGYLDTREFARDRVALPKEGDDASYQEFAEKLRPASADDYKLPVQDGDDGKMTEAFKPLFHEIGMPQQMAHKLVEGYNKYQGDIAAESLKKGQESLTAFELEIGSDAYNRRISAVENMLTSIGLDDLEQGKLIGTVEMIAGDAGKAIRALATLAERTGELEKVDGMENFQRFEGMAPAAAQEQINSLMGDSDFMAKAAQQGTPEYQKWNNLNKAASRSPV